VAFTAAGQEMRGQETGAAFPQPAASHSFRMESRTLLSVTSSMQLEKHGESEGGTALPHWPAAPAVQLLAPINTAAYSEARVPQELRPPSTGEPPAPLAPPVAPLSPAPLLPPVPGTYEQKPALPPSVDTQVRLSAAGQRRTQGGSVVAQPIACQSFSIVVSAEVSVT
jgi:hypothetical protein